MNIKMGSVPAWVVALLLFGACNSNRTAMSDPGPDPVTTTDGARSTGTITTDFAGEGCPILMLLDGRAEEPILLPIALDERYKKQGTRLSFTWRPSRASSGECLKGMPAILEDIRVL